MGKFGITIDGRHTSEIGLKMTKMYIPMPEPKASLISVPGASGSIDLSEVTGQICYNDRSGIQFSFVLEEKDYSKWAAKLSQIALWIHGKKVKVIVDNDLSFYYMCRLNVDGNKSNKAFNSIVLSGTSEPFKYDIQASDEEWLWDTFDFELGVIRELSNIEITDSNRSVTIIAGAMPVSPEFIVKESMNLTVTYSGRTYTMAVAGTYRFPSIKVGNTDVALTFGGTGKLSIRYRGAYL